MFQALFGGIWNVCALISTFPEFDLLLLIRVKELKVKSPQERNQY